MLTVYFSLSSQGLTLFPDYTFHSGLGLSWPGNLSDIYSDAFLAFPSSVVAMCPCPLPCHLFVASLSLPMTLATFSVFPVSGLLPSHSFVLFRPTPPCELCVLKAQYVRLISRSYLLLEILLPTQIPPLVLKPCHLV